MGLFVPVLAYHKVQNNFDFSVGYVTLAQFEEQIKYLHDNHYQSTTVEEYLSQPHASANSVVITFDDAYACVYEHAFPILKKYNYRATIFVITKFVGARNSWDYQLKSFQTRHCDWKQLKRLRLEGWEVGSHTVTHPDLSTLTTKALWHELKYSKELLESKLKSPVSTISYPYGRFSEDVMKIVSEAGYLGACTLGHNFPHDQHLPYALFRRGVYHFEPLPLFKQKLKNNNWSRCDDVKQRFLSFCAQGSILVRQLRDRSRSPVQR